MQKQLLFYRPYLILKLRGRKFFFLPHNFNVRIGPGMRLWTALAMGWIRTIFNRP